VDCLDCHICNFSRVYMNLKCKIISIKIFNSFIIHVTMDFSENLIKNYGWVLKIEWIHCGLLKWWHYVCHTQKMKNVDSKKYHSDIKFKIKK